MATVKVTSRFRILELIDRFVDDATAKDLGQTVVNEAKELIATGQSPVAGIGRYIGYSESYAGQIKGAGKAAVGRAVAKAVNGVKKPKQNIVARKAKEKAQKLNKKVRPVNLYGGKGSPHMLDGYDYRIGPTKDTITVGMVGGSSDKKEIAGYHQEGTRKMPARPLVPGEGESWAVSIMRAIRDRYSKRLADLIRQSNKKS